MAGPVAAAAPPARRGALSPSPMERELLARIAARRARVGVIGLGYVGLPLACAFAEDGFPVLGLDCDPAKVDALRAARSYIHHLPSARLAAITAPLERVLASQPGRGFFHSCFDPELIMRHSRLVVDTRNLMRRVRSGRHRIVQA